MRSSRPARPNSSWASATSTMSTRSQAEAKRGGVKSAAIVRVSRRARTEMTSGSPTRNLRRAARLAGTTTPRPVSTWVIASAAGAPAVES
jgi:hypothetical protein